MTDVEAKPIYKRWWFITFTIFFLAFVASLSDSQEPGSTTDPSRRVAAAETEKPTGKRAAKSTEPIEYQLAVINAGGYVREDDASVRRFASLLGSLDSNFPEDQQQVADMSVRAQQLLREDGIEESLLNIMEGMNRVGARNFSKAQYAEVIALYLTLRDQSQAHDEAIAGLAELLRALGK